MIIWIWWCIAINFWVFSNQVIEFIGGKSFIGTFENIWSRWSNQVLPFLWVVLFLSFIKQVYNYLFVAVDKQNVLLPINLIGVFVGIPLWIRMIPRYGLFGGVITQITIELIFMFGAILVGKRKKIQPIFSWAILWKLCAILLWMAIIGYFITYFRTLNIFWFFVVALCLNLFFIFISLWTIKKIAKGLTVDETTAEVIY